MVTLLKSGDEFLSSYEEYFVEIFQKEDVRFVREINFKDLKHGLFRFDFFLEEDNILVEVDGQYHFKPIRGRRELLKQQEHDRKKNSYCLANGIKLYRVPYWEISTIKKVKDIFQDKFLVKSRWHNDNLKHY